MPRRTASHPASSARSVRRVSPPPKQDLLTPSGATGTPDQHRWRPPKRIPRTNTVQAGVGASPGRIGPRQRPSQGRPSGEERGRTEARGSGRRCVDSVHARKCRIFLRQSAAAELYLGVPIRGGEVRGGGSGQWDGLAGPRLGFPRWCLEVLLWESSHGMVMGAVSYYLGVLSNTSVGLLFGTYAAGPVSCLRPIFGRLARLVACTSNKFLICLRGPSSLVMAAGAVVLNFQLYARTPEPTNSSIQFACVVSGRRLLT